MIVMHEKKFSYIPLNEHYKKTLFLLPPSFFRVARSNKYPSFSFPPFYIYAGRKYNQNLSVARARGGTSSPMGTSPTPGSCIHRRHMRLESLRTLILADNKLTRLSLYLDESDFSLVTEVDENEVSDEPVLPRR